MEEQEIERKLYSILSGLIPIKIQGESYTIKEPSSMDIMYSNILYSEKLEEATSLNVITSEEAIEKLISVGLWSDVETQHLESLPKAIEDLKVQLYLAYINFRSRKPIVKVLSKRKKEFMDMSVKKSVLHEQTCEGFAELCRSRYLICSNVLNLKGERFFAEGDYSNCDNNLITEIISEYLSSNVKESELRDISKCDSWKNFWTAGKSESGVFGKPAVELTTNQKAVISWSRIYDSIHESHECPSTAVLEDDDMLDGWLIYQNRQREKEQSQKIDSSKGQGVKGNEVFIMADTEEDAQRIYDMNSSHGKATIKNLQKQADSKREEGKALKAEKTFEAQLEMRQIANEQFKQKARG